GQGVVQAAQFGADVTAAAGQQDPQPLPQVAAGAGAGAELRVPAGRAAFPEGRVGAGGDRAHRAGGGGAAGPLHPPAPPPLSPPRGRRPASGARRFWQALPHGRPVAWEISQDALRPQIEQVTVDYSPAPVMRARLGRSCPTPAVAPPAALAVRDRPPAATGSIR